MSHVSDPLERTIQTCVARLRRFSGTELPIHAMILGSGFEGISDIMKVQRSIGYDKLPGFPVPSVPGHVGRLLLAELEGLPFLVCCGRAHYYEGAAMETVTFVTRVLAEAGITRLLITNAAGGLNPRFRPGDFMLFKDHINFTGVNPLRGVSIDEGRCFVDLNEAYSRDLRRKMRTAAKKAGIVLHEGIYLGVSGPSYETPAEIRAFRKLGADAVGMSTIPEVLMARYCGVEVAAFSCITNYAAGLAPGRLTHDEVLAVGQKSAKNAAFLLKVFARELRERGIHGKKV